MGLYILPYAADLQALRESIGSNNATLLTEVLDSDTFHQYSQPDDSFPGRDNFDLEKAMEQLIMGTITDDAPVKAQSLWQRVLGSTAKPAPAL